MNRTKYGSAPYWTRLNRRIRGFLRAVERGPCRVPIFFIWKKYGPKVSIYPKKNIGFPATFFLNETFIPKKRQISKNGMVILRAV